MQGQQLSGTFGCPARSERHVSAQDTTGRTYQEIAALQQFRRQVEQQWQTVRVLRAQKDSAASKELAALRIARRAERTLRALELQVASKSYVSSQAGQP